MKLRVTANTSAFTTRSLKRVIARAFDRVGVARDVDVRFIGQKRGKGAFSFEKGQEIAWPVDEALDAISESLTVRLQGKTANFWVGPELDSVTLCSYARYVGYGIRGVKGLERKRMYPASPADREFLGDKPLVHRMAETRRLRRLAARSGPEIIERRAARTAAALERAKVREQRAKAAVRRLTKKLARLKRAAERAARKEVAA